MQMIYPHPALHRPDFAFSSLAARARMDSHDCKNLQCHVCKVITVDNLSTPIHFNDDPDLKVAGVELASNKQGRENTLADTAIKVEPEYLISLDLPGFNIGRSGRQLQA